MELLAPAGTKEALVAAVEAGADAVYIGIEGFNARQRARNFNIYDVEVMTKYLHSQKKRLYVAMNVLIKEREIPAVFDLLNRLSALPVDGVIVHDLGLIHLCRNYFKELHLHASTQMVIHNSEGVKCLERLGFRRVILSREISINEIREISNKTTLELEVFCHGALCFSVSGLCLASSYMGGHSGNRGLCTQPCRRLWKGDGTDGFFFSMRDLESGSLVSELRKAGVRSLKIEGRMRSPEYVKRVVQAYRMLIDGSERSHVKKSECSSGPSQKFHVDDLARRKTQYFLLGKRGDIIDFNEPPTLGTLLGEVEKVEDGKVTVLLTETVTRGDRVKIASRHAVDDESDVFPLGEVTFHSDSSLTEKRMSFDFSGRAAAGDRLFLLGRKGSELSHYSGKVDQLYRDYEKIKKPLTRRYSEMERMSIEKRIRSPWKRPQFPCRKPSVRIDDPGWLKVIESKAVEEVIIAIGAQFQGESESLICRIPSSRVIFELPLFVPETSLEPLKNTVRYLVKRGYRRWMVQNLSHFGILPSGVEITAGPFLYSLNSQALRQLKELGVRESICSYEDEYLNIRDVLSHWDGSRKAFLFAHVPLFFTQVKMDPAISAMKHLALSSMAAFIRRCGSGTAVVSARPFSIFQSRKKLEMLRLQGYIIDLAFTLPSRELWRKVREHFEKSLPFPGSRKFNFKIGLK